MATRVILNHSGVKIIGIQSEMGFYLRAYENGIFKEESKQNPTFNERGLFIQRWF